MAKSETIIKTSKNKDGVIQEKTYYVNADYKPEKINDISMEFIINYCKENGKDAIAWLKEIANKEEIQTRTTKGGVENTIKVRTPFVTIRTEFAKRYFPNIIVGAKSGKSYLDIINSL